MRSRTDVAGLSCAVVSGRGGGLTCAAAVVVLYRQPRRACAPPGSGADCRPSPAKPKLCEVWEARRPCLSSGGGARRPRNCPA